MDNQRLIEVLRMTSFKGMRPGLRLKASGVGRAKTAYNSMAWAAASESSESGRKFCIDDLYDIKIFSRVLFLLKPGRLGRFANFCGLFNDLESVQPRTRLGRYSDDSDARPFVLTKALKIAYLGLN